jgi:hypothetical protein
MDWGWVYATLIRNTGWTFAQCWEQPAFEVFEFLEHLNQYPSADVVLRAVYCGKPKSRPSQKQSESDRQELGSILGPPQPLPENLRGLFDWIEQQDAPKK